MTHVTHNRRYRHRRTNLARRRSLTFVTVGTVLVLLLLAGLTYLTIRNHLAAFATELELTATYLEQAIKNPQQALPQAQFHLRNARSIIEPYRPVAGLVATRADWLPGIGQMANWWTFVDEATLAGENALNAANLSLVATKQGQLTNLLSKAPQIEPYLTTADSHFRRAQLARPKLDTGWLPARLVDRAEAGLTQWDKVTLLWPETFGQAALLVRTLPPALGNSRPMTYLVIIQSSDNLRATGGFLTSVGQIKLEQGRLTYFEFRDVVESEFSTQWSPEAGFLSARVVPPDPVRRYLGLGHWVMRDGNWWADFPTTAHQVAKFWQLAGGQPVDGVIGLTDQAIAGLLEVAGPLSLSGEQTLTVRNMKAVTADHIHNGERNAGNKQSAFFQQVAARLAPQIQQLPPDRWLALTQQLQSMIRRRDLQVASFDPTLALAFHQLNLDGSLRGQTDDYFYLVEDNLADSKLNSFVTQNLHYEVDLNPNGAATSARLTIQKKNEYVPGTQLAGFPLAGYYTGGRWDAQTQQWDKWEGYYGGYLRLFPTPDSQLIDATGFDDPVDTKPEHNRPVFGGYVGLWAGTHRQLEFSWAPGGQPQEAGRYRLLVQRQPGALDHPLTVQVHLPPGYQAIEISPPPAAITEQSIIWQTTLAQDRAFTLQLSP